MAKLKVLFCSAEVVPFAKTGGLADVAGSLPLALEALGVDVRIVMPKYSTIKISGNETTIGKNIKVYFIANDEYYSRPGLYGDKFGDYADNLERFSYYSKKVLELIKDKKFVPDVLHCHDWQAALPIILMRTLYKDDPVFKKIKTIFTIHNLAYQGLFPKDKLSSLGLGPENFTIDTLEFYDKINLLKGGIVFSDFITTVSRTYAKEIETSEFGCGLEGVLKKRSGDVYGIINGIDYDVWNPATDKALFKTYDVKSCKSGKVANKIGLQKETKLKQDSDAPMIGLISRLADQKGADLVSEIIEEILGMGAQFVLLGTGENKYHILFEEVAKKYSKSASINLKFDAVLAQRIYAACDMFLIPSRYEPCGLGQMISLKYGTIPIVRKTGGLADTISEFNPKTKKGNGFVFTEATPAELLKAIKRAFAVYKEKKLWDGLTKDAMEYDFSWNESAKQYVDLYKKVLAKNNTQKCYAAK